MIDTDTREIGGYSYSVTQLGAKEGRRILVKLVKVLGPSLGHLLGIEGGNVTDKSLSEAFYELSQNVTEKDLDDLCKTFGERTEVEIGGKLQRLDLKMQELHFAGDFSNMFRWIGFCLELNYKDFFSALKEANPLNVSPKGEPEAT